MPTDLLAPNAAALMQQLENEDLGSHLAKLDLNADAEVRVALCEALASGDFHPGAQCARPAAELNAGGLRAGAAQCPADIPQPVTTSSIVRMMIRRSGMKR